jgi:predicted transcriptional regulator
VSFTKKTIKEILPGLQGCPKEGDLWQPKGQMAQRVYQFLKKGTPKDDSTICRNGDVSGTLACTLLAAGQTKLETT